MTEHTPGPWHTGSGSAQVIVYGPDGYAVANAKVFYGRQVDIAPFETAKANARLIAAAPELLIAACSLVEAIALNDGLPRNPEVLERVRLAIAEAVDGWAPK